MTEFIARNYGNKEYELIIKTDNKAHYKEAQDFARRLIDHAKPMTNADYIRSMSDEELAEFLYIELLDEDGCRDHILNWLKQPPKENEE